VSRHPLRRSSHHEWLVAGGLLLLLGLFASAIAGGLPGTEAMPVQLLASLERDGNPGSISADGLGLVVDGAPGDAVARMHFTLPQRADRDDPWVVWIERKPVERVQLTRGDWHSEQRGFFSPNPDAGPCRPVTCSSCPTAGRAISIFNCARPASCRRCCARG
jgi:hypothetical protein